MAVGDIQQHAKRSRFPRVNLYPPSFVQRQVSCKLCWLVGVVFGESYVGESMDHPTFLTKIRLPQRRPEVLRRPRLVDFLHQHVDKRLIMVCAGAGYCKTTLLVDFANDVDLPVCWYSIDASDADPRSFFDYLLLSIQQRFPDFGRQTASLLKSVEDVGKEINSLVASLVNEIQSDIPDYFLLILDDYHWIDSSEGVNSALDLLIYYLPDNCHLVLSTRQIPVLTFSRMAARRQVAGLGTVDLRFTPEELSKLLLDNYKLALPAAHTQQLIEASEGWITGILLTTHTQWMGLVESLVKARGADSPLFDYLANEAYLQQPPEVQRFLLYSSVLHQMTPELCDRLFAEGTAAETLRYLLGANLFVAALEGPGEWFRYHNLFQEFLQAKLKTEDSALYAQLHRRSAEMAEEKGEWEWAVTHYQAAGDGEGAASLVERVGEGMMSSGHWQTLHRWLDSLPTATVDARPKLALCRGRTYLWVGELERAIAHLDRAAQQFRSQGDLEGAGGALTAKSVGLRTKGRLGEALNACKEVLALQLGPDTRVAAEARQEFGICLASQGKLSEAAMELEHALETYQALGDEPGIATVSHSMGIISVRTGDLVRGMAYYQSALALWQQLGNFTSTAEQLNNIAMVYYDTGEYGKALSVLDEALAIARRGGRLRIEAWVLSSLGDVRRDSGNTREALDPYEAALEIAQRVEDIRLVNYLLDALANTHRLLGDFATAERLLRQALRQAEESQSFYEETAYTVSYAVLAEEQGDLDRAEELLRSAVQRLATFGAPRNLARARFHLARTLFARGNSEGAAQELEACLELCRQLGYDQFLVTEGRRAGQLLTWAVARGIGGKRLELVAERLLPAPLTFPARRQRIRIEPSGPKEISIYSFGYGKVVVDSRPLTTSDWAEEKTRELFFYLLQQSHSLRKEQIVDDMWPELEEGKSTSHFHSTMYRLRRALFPQCVTYHDGRYQLTLGKACWFDAAEFARLLGEADRGDLQRPQQIERYQCAVDLYKGPFLEEFYSDWVLPRREELEMRYLQAINRLAKLKAQEGALEQALELLRAAVVADPYQEDAHYGLIHYSALMGDRAAALRHYKGYVELLRDELDAEPAANFLALADRIAQGKSVPSL